VIFGPWTSTVRFVCWHVRSTTVRDLRLLMATVSVCEPQCMIRVRSGHPGQRELRSRAGRVLASSRIGLRAGGTDTCA
jgi:hypothetical protein